MFAVDQHDDDAGGGDDDDDDDDIAIIEQSNGDASNDQAQILADNEYADRNEAALGDHAEREDEANHRHGKAREAKRVSTSSSSTSDTSDSNDQPMHGSSLVAS